MKTKKFMVKNPVIAVFLALAFLTGGAFAKGTPAGTFLISTNAWATYSNTANAPVGYVTNSTNSGITNLVLSVYGFSNYSVQYATNTNSVVAGNTYYYPLWISNHGNTNASVAVSAGSNYGGAFGSPWTVLFVDTVSNALASNPSNLPPDSELRYMVKVTVPNDAGDTSSMSIIVTNAIADAAAATRTYAYNSPSNAMWYGGTNYETNVINLLVGGPRLVLNKSYTVTNLSLNNAQVVPGSVITFTIAYTNMGSGSAGSVVLEDRIDNTYLTYAINTAVGGTVDFDLNNANTWGAAGNTATTASINANLTGLRFAMGTVTAGGSGTVTYQVVVK